MAYLFFDKAESILLIRKAIKNKEQAPLRRLSKSEVSFRAQPVDETAIILVLQLRRRHSGNSANQASMSFKFMLDFIIIFEVHVEVFEYSWIFTQEREAVCVVWRKYKLVTI